jgi:hypothetical protein
MRFALLLIFAICANLPAYGRAAPTTIPVGVVKAEKKPISRRRTSSPGRAINRVRSARVKGFLR